MADPASSDLDDTGTTSLFNWASDRLTLDSWGIGDFLKAGIGLTVVGMFTGVMDIFNAIIGLVTTPMTAVAESVSKLYQGLVEEPVSILVTGAETTSRSIEQVLTGYLGIGAFVVGVGVVLAGLYVVSIYLEEPATSDWAPGSYIDVDVPEFIPIIGDPGVAEEGEDQEDRD